MRARTNSAVRLIAFRTLASVVVGFTLAGCASPEDTRGGVIDSQDLEKAPFVGTWTSDLDGAMLEIEPTGVFAIDVPAKGAEPARGAVGRWNWNGAEVVFTNLRGAGPCADLPGVYGAEVVRDTVRFTLVRDECAPREEHMAWPWRRREREARR